MCTREVKNGGFDGYLDYTRRRNEGVAMRLCMCICLGGLDYIEEVPRHL